MEVSLYQFDYQSTYIVHVPINYVVLLIMYNDIKILIIVALVVRLALGGNVEVSLYQSDYQSTYMYMYKSTINNVNDIKIIIIMRHTMPYLAPKISAVCAAIYKSLDLYTCDTTWKN